MKSFIEMFRHEAICLPLSESCKCLVKVTDVTFHIVQAQNSSLVVVAVLVFLLWASTELVLYHLWWNTDAHDKGQWSCRFETKAGKRKGGHFGVCLPLRQVICKTHKCLILLFQENTIMSETESIMEKCGCFLSLKNTRENEKMTS